METRKSDRSGSVENVHINLKILSEKNLLSQIVMAEYLNVDRSYISKVFKNERRMSVYHLDKLSEPLGLKSSDFYLEKEFFERKINVLSFRSMADKKLSADLLQELSRINRIKKYIRHGHKIIEKYERK
ncbi:MAG: helix-turn-helix transcriptional regulator [Candidatus Marinimicrobia bacterium]|nr:helix-turn-helix transcriptional regulator [Candidatus Neomarinimicrobiota bacterium]